MNTATRADTSVSISVPAVLPIHLIPSQVRPVAYRILSKKHGLNLKSGGLEALTKTLGHKFGVDWRSSKAEKFLDQIAKIWKEQDRGLFIEGGDALTTIIRDILNLAADSEKLAADGNHEEYRAIRTTSIKGNSKPFHWRDYFKVVNAHDQPAYTYNHIRKHFELPAASQRQSMLGSAKSRANLFLNRYYILHDRLYRNEMFQPLSFNTKNQGNTYSITMIKNMLGRDNNRFLLLGMLTKGADGNMWLQDSSGRIELDIESHALASEGSYFTQGSFVFSDGVYMNEKFIVESLGPPPPERRDQSKEAYGSIDFLGIHGKPSNGQVERIEKAFERQLRAQERELSHHKIIILGMNIFLDQLKILDALRSLFMRLENEAKAADNVDSALPIAIVFPGSFMSTPFQPNGSSTVYKESFDVLAQLMSEFPLLFNSSSVESPHLVFVPGDNDPWAATFTAGTAPAWPLKPIPQVFTNRIRREAGAANVMWASNPARLSYLSQEILIVRDDYGARFRRNSVVFLKELEMEIAKNANNDDEEIMDVDESETIDDSGDDDLYDSDRETNRVLTQIIKDEQKTISQLETPYVAPDVAEARKIVKTILDQGHLSPFPLTIRPVTWDYDHALSLCPLPTMMVIADPTTPRFRVTYEGCHVINPGLFLERRKINWIEYVPSNGTSVERSEYV